MTATNERENQEKTPDAVKAAEAGLGERLAANPEAVKAELAQEATHEAAKFGAESTELTTKVEAAAGPLDAETKAAVAGTEAEAQRAAGELAKDLGVEKKEKEPLIRTFEYRDSEGRLIGTATVELSSEIISRTIMLRQPERKVRRLTNYKLTGPDGQEIALREMIKDFDELKVDIYIPDESEEGIPPFFARNDDGEAFVCTRLPDNVLNLATMLHELGHAEQSDVKERLAELWNLGDVAKDVYRNAAGLDWTKARPLIAKMKEQFPDSTLVTDEMVMELDANFAAYDAAKKEETEAHAFLQETARGDDAAARSAASDAWLAKREDFKKIAAVIDPLRTRVRAAAMFVIKVFENDAWLRADGWMKEAKERTGADLYAPTLSSPKDAGYDQKKCASDVEDGVAVLDDADIKMEASVRDLMRSALETYMTPTKKVS